MQDSAALRQALLNPKSIALVGASSNPAKNTARPLRFMIKHQYDGKVFPINAMQSEVLGKPAYKSLADLPEPVDHVFIMIPGVHVMGMLDECAQAGAKVVTVYSDGFAESGPEGQKQQDALAEKAKSLGLRIIGPNSIGIANLHSGSILSVNAAFESDTLNTGDIALISQSGSMMGSLFSRASARGFGFSHLISVGNECDLSVGEIVDALVDDPHTRTILLFLETIRKPALLAKALQRARAAGKPVIAYKLGRSQQGATLSQSHTGALAGNDAATDAFLREFGVMRVELLETLFEIIPLAANYFHAPRPKFGSPRRVAVLTTTGGGAATAVDRLGLYGIEAATPPLAFIEKIAARGLSISHNPIIDLTLAGTSKQYKMLLEELLNSDWCDAVLSVVGSSAQFHPSLAIAPIVESIKPDTKPLLTFLTPDAHESLTLLKSHNIAAFRTPESCADALAAFFTQVAPSASAVKSDQTMTWPAQSPRTGDLSEHHALHIWQTLGIKTAASALITDTDTEHNVPYPVALKVASPDILHKTEVAGVRLGIKNGQELQQALTEIHAHIQQAAPNARIDGYLVQHMESKLIELILGYRLDPLVGPIVVLGMGGIAAELHTDSSIRLAPVSKEQALEMISEVRHTELIRGYRNLPRGDCDALADAIVALSTLANANDVVVTDAEINPLFIQRDKVVAVDGLICLR